MLRIADVRNGPESAAATRGRWDTAILNRPMRDRGSHYTRRTLWLSAGRAARESQRAAVSVSTAANP